MSGQDFARGMPHVDLQLRESGDGAWPDLLEVIKAGKLIHTTSVQIAALPRGMSSGAPSVSMRFDLEDGRSVILETSLKMFLSVADALKAKYGDPRGLS